MKTTVEIPDELFRAAKSKAALDGRKLKDLVAEGLKLVLRGKPKSSGRTPFPLIRSRGGVVTSKQVAAAISSEWQEEAKTIARAVRR